MIRAIIYYYTLMYIYMIQKILNENEYKKY